MKYKISDIATIISGGTPKKTIAVYWNGNIPWLTIKDFNTKTVTSITSYISDDGLNNSSTNLTKNGDILISARGTVGKLLMVRPGMTFNQSIYCIRPNEQLVNPEYLYYWLYSNIDKIKKGVHGSVFDTITRKTFDLIEINLPDLSIQQELSNKIKILDEKAELNRQINANLDDLMSEIFERYVTEAKVFTTDSLSNIADYKNGLAMQKFRPNGADKGLPVLKIKELNQGFTDSSSDRCSSTISNDVIIKTGDIIFSWSGTLIVKIWTGTTCGLNQHLFKVTSDKYPKWFIYKWTEYYLRQFQSIAAGKATTMGHIKRNDLEQAEVKIPYKSEIDRLNKLISPIFKRYVNNILEINSLKELKNELVSKLF